MASSVPLTVPAELTDEAALRLFLLQLLDTVRRQQAEIEQLKNKL
jgi:hypothetical protein